MSRPLPRRYGRAKPPRWLKIKKGDPVVVQFAGELFDKRGVVEHVRPDALLIVHFDHDPPGAIRVVSPAQVRVVR